jgi:hypothetical protein
MASTNGNGSSNGIPALDMFYQERTAWAVPFIKALKVDVPTEITGPQSDNAKRQGISTAAAKLDVKVAVRSYEGKLYACLLKSPVTA